MEETQNATPTLQNGQMLHQPRKTPSLEEILARPIVPLVSEYDEKMDDTSDMLPNRVHETSDEDPQRRLMERLQRIAPMQPASMPGDMVPSKIEIKAF